MRIWMESKESKAQWECVVKDFKEHLGKGVTHHLPSNVILTSLQDGLSSMDHDVEEEMEVDGCDVDLTESQDGHLNLELNLKAFRSLEVKYDFDMKPMKIEKVDILEAKIRDLEEDKIPAFLFVSSTEAVNQDEDIVWDEESSSNEDFFELSEDMTENGLSALAKDEKPSEAGGSMVALKHLKSGHIELVLTLTAFGCLEGTYSFDMMPMEIDKIDILEAKIRDLEESSCGKIFRPVVLSLSLNFNVTPNCYITWTVVEKPCAKCFELSQDPRSISVVESGLYYIQFDGYLTNWSNGSGVKMLMDNATITSAPVHNDGHGHKATITHLLIATKATVLMFQVYGSFNLKSGATLSIARLHEFCAA
ncbi:hypothetical protein Ae201684P_000929 [Aphanomyces euteiches]|nr:hypothetical protein Ae201684P_000929 [Aphanomyces euteiches]